MAPPPDAATDPQRPRGDRRAPALDVIRGAAMLTVLVVHGPEIPVGAWGHSLDVLWKRCGWASVDIFFALSGFLIMALLLAEQERTGSIDVRAFFVRRIFKIYPPYVVYLLALVAWEYGRGQGSPLHRLSLVATDLWPAFAHLQNYIPLRSAPHLWSLAMEEHCYALLLVLALIHAARSTEERSSRVIPIAVGALFGASWLARWAHVAWSYSGVGPIGFTYTHHRIDALLAGTLAAWFVRSRRGATLTRRGRALLALAAVLCFLPTLSLEANDHRVLFLLGVFPLQAVGFGCLMVMVGMSSSLDATGGGPLLDGRASLAGASHGEAAVRDSAWPVRALAFIAVTSYSAYLWHLPFTSSLAGLLRIPRLIGWHPAGPALCLASFVALPVGMGALLFWMIERPAQSWRRRWLRVRDPRGEPRLQPAEVA